MKYLYYKESDFDGRLAVVFENSVDSVSTEIVLFEKGMQLPHNASDHKKLDGYGVLLGMYDRQSFAEIGHKVGRYEEPCLSHLLFCDDCHVYTVRIEKVSTHLSMVP